MFVNESALKYIDFTSDFLYNTFCNVVTNMISHQCHTTITVNHVNNASKHSQRSLNFIYIHIIIIRACLFKIIEYEVARNSPVQSCPC